MFPNREKSLQDSWGQSKRMLEFTSEEEGLLLNWLRSMMAYNGALTSPAWGNHSEDMSIPIGIHLLTPQNKLCDEGDARMYATEDLDVIKYDDEPIYPELNGVPLNIDTIGSVPTQVLESLDKRFKFLADAGSISPDWIGYAEATFKAAEDRKLSENED